MSSTSPVHNQSSAAASPSDEQYANYPPQILSSKGQPSGSVQVDSQHGTMEPPTPTTPFNSEGKEGKQKRPNPLTDLVETEKTFVEQLTGIIRKVAAAWSRSNLPPPELDTMFRSIEAIYKANRGLHAKLKDISADPRSAGELGGLLINWIDDLRKPYETYCSKYCHGFDEWEPVQSNARLGPVLAQFSSTSPAPSNNGIWTLDSLFILPKTRLNYYLKLYKRLLKNTQNPLLVSAVDTLIALLDTFDGRSSARVGQDGPGASNAPSDSVDEVVIDMRKQAISPPAAVDKLLRSIENETKTGSETSSNYGSLSGGERSSRESETTTFSRASTQTLSMPISDLERRLSVDRTLDIFTMAPKAVKLQMSPPNLTFTRELRTSMDVVIRFTPRATGAEVVHREGHIFILSDLFLICDRITTEDRQRRGNDGADMWLCYPPLAGKVLRVQESTGQANALQVAIMRKEYLTLETLTKEGRDSLISHFKDCVEFSASLPPPSKTPPPPLPSFNAFPRLQSDSAASSPSSTQLMHRTSGSTSPSPSGIPPPGTNGPGNPSDPPPPAYPVESKSLPPEPNMRSDLPPIPPPSMGGPGELPPLRTSSSAQPLSRDPPFTPATAIPPARSTGFVPGNEPMSAGPGFAPPRNLYGGPPFASSSMTNLAPHPSNPQFRPPPNNFNPGGYAPPHPSGYPPGPPHGQGYPPNGISSIPRNNSLGSGGGGLRPMPPSARAVSMAEVAFNEPSPPNSPEQRPQDIGPVTSTISAQMKCKVFLQQHHAQWKALGSAKLKLYRQDPTNVKQLVVEAENKDKSVLISTIVLTDGVERVGKTGVAIELSDKGTRTGIVYMIQLRNETSAGGLFDSLLAGSDRAAPR